MSSKRESDRVATIIPAWPDPSLRTVHAAARYDLSIDTTSSSPEQVVTDLMRLLTCRGARILRRGTIGPVLLTGFGVTVVP